ncbi:UDP-2,3-diacylglucosamine diphosphatase [Roseicitreum antarcticum]|uniref:UDP-2,3-diacylglucosamine pyrophosphatase LpxH n=1 Tax=Roseicitreum antarcticum TaxID=564137 RepID=A0A1H2TT95_9RHOB|nr:UDP-2,3-diacylglucosamine diphosphatase [Roseicitreum antarcticum]SDW47112.1 UDP-2,3-diacylglucosamine pyrophosphatase LpxH [Roseicitreum antarcticum]
MSPATASLPTAPAATPRPSLPRMRALFISDLHLGYKGADIRALNEMLKACEPEHLYLVGDVFDGWKLEKRWYWTQDYCDLIDILMSLRRRRVPITLITGNHDEKLREVIPKLFRPLILCRYGIRIEERCMHRTARGKKLLVIHGDQFDGALWRGGSKIADQVWGWLTERGLIPPPRPGRRWSLRRAINRENGSLNERHVSAALRRAIHDGADGIVFGHSHVPILDRREGRAVANCGAWTVADGGMHTAIAETPEGRLEMLHWPSTPRHNGKTAAPCTRDEARQEGPRSETAEHALPAPVLSVQDPDSARLIRYVYALWRPMQPGMRNLPRPAASPADASTKAALRPTVAA